MSSAESIKRSKAARWLIVGLGLILMLGVLAGCGLAVLGSDDDGQDLGSPTLPQSETEQQASVQTMTHSPAPHIREVPESVTPTASPTLTADCPETPTSELPPKKATALANHPTPAPTAKPTLVAGINNWDRQGAGPAQLFLVRNSWRGPIAGRSDPWLIVYAGATKRQPEGTPVAGALRIFTISPETLHTESVGTFTAPTSSPLTIVSVDDDVLELRSDDGAKFEFDLQTLKFISN